MISSHKTPLRFLAASLLVSGLSFASIVSAAKINITIQTDQGTEDAIEKAFGAEVEIERKEIFPVELEVDEDTVTVGYIKERMEEKTAVPPEFQTLEFKNTKLEGDEKKLKDYGIKDQDKLDWKR
ncbi:ubiquitin-like domain-containing protein [Pseudoxanthomonas sp. UTMC 1351]|uniref:ubiquitin-like domain-containing protein n=1 Tax=Pseudoxanthomonas sp. UTMC 1351 TaxID=2695853 RepID=UPI0034CE15AC